jgi:ankyrin repeat protein
VRALLESGRIGVNVASFDNATPLYIAAQEGHVDMVQLLHKYGADLNLARNHCTPVCCILFFSLLFYLL